LHNFADKKCAFLLASAQLAPSPVIETDGHAIVVDLSAGSPLLRNEPPAVDVGRLGKLIDSEMHKAGTGFAFGRYAEDRALYDNDNFAGKDGGERRTVHLGIDLFCAAGTDVHAPLAGQIEIVANNQAELDYGPLLVLKHVAGQCEFYSLYGHLELQSIAGRRAGQSIDAGEFIATVGAPPENGNWPPHLHFQLILDLLGLGRDFPGVACRSQLDFWQALSPSPAVFFPECDESALNAQD
jgi:hypothetical protein